MFQSSASIDVLVVGAGPSGLTLAAILARYGVSFRIVEAKSYLSRHTKASNLMQRSQEVVAALGLLGPIAEIGGAMRRIMVTAYGKSLGPRTMHVDESPYPDVLLCGQNVFEAEMARALRRSGVTIEFDTALTHLEPRETSVIATLRTRLGDERVTCAYVAGCDGANGITRTFTRFDFAPAKTGVTLRQVDCTLSWRRLSTMDQMWLNYFDRGFSAVVPLPGDVHRVITCEPSEAVPQRDPTLAEMQAKMRDVYADDAIELRDLRWASHADLSMGIADGLVDGRIVLVGDVGNPILPNGGQGMNVGISDAFALGWRLASLTRGSEAPLLATYAQERRTVRAALEKSQAASLKYTTLVTPHLMQRAFRAFGDVALDRGGERAMARAFSQLTVTTRGSAMTLEAGGRGAVRAGDRVLDADVVEGLRTMRLFDYCYRGAWTLLAFTGTSGVAAAAVRTSLARLSSIDVATFVVSTSSRERFDATVLYDLDEVAHRAYGVAEPVLYLVRPDGHVGARVAPRRADELVAYARRWIAAMPSPSPLRFAPVVATERAAASI